MPSHFDNSLSHYSEHLIKLGVESSFFSQIETYLNLLWQRNEELNLFSRKTTKTDLIENHIIDCLLAVPYLPKNLSFIADLGSGGGLPAILYSILMPNAEYHLYEKSPKKQNFLSECQKTLNLNIQVKGLIPQTIPNYNLITARAFKPTDVILDLTQSYFKSGGKYFLLKGRKDTFEPELIAAQKKFLKFNFKIQKIPSPVLDVERHLVLINP